MISAISALDPHRRQQLVAILQLMEDPDNVVQQQIRETLRQWGPSLLPALRYMAHAATPLQRRWIENFIREYQVEALEAFQDAMMAAISGRRSFSLEEVFFQISRFGYPETDPIRWKQYLDRLASQCAAEQRTGIELYHSISRILFAQEGFRGAWQEEYYHPDASYAHTVFQYRRGNPLSLALLYWFIAQRLRIELMGVNMPLHFILYVPALDLFIDPFQGGQFLSYEECRMFIERNHLSFSPLMLQPASPISIVLRMLRNLVYGYNRMNRTWESSILQQCIHTILETIEDHGEN